MKKRLIHLLTLISAAALCSCAPDFRSFGGDFGRRPGGYGFDLRRDSPRDTGGWGPRLGGGGSSGWGGGGGSGGRRGSSDGLRLLGDSGGRTDRLTPAGRISLADRIRLGGTDSVRLAPGGRPSLADRLRVGDTDSTRLSPGARDRLLGL